MSCLRLGGPVLAVLLTVIPLLAGCAAERRPGMFVREAESEEVEAAFVSAMAAFDRKDYAEAGALFQDVIEKYPGSRSLMEAQWMTARSEEMQGRWKRALSQYEAFSLNYPRNPHAEEVGLRIRLLRELLEEAPRERLHPPIRAFEMAGTDRMEESPESYGRRGINAVVVDTAGDAVEISPERVDGIHQSGLYLFSSIRLDLRDLFSPEARRRLKRLCGEIGVRGFDGIFFEPVNGSVGEWFRRDILEQFDDAFGSGADPDRLLGDAEIYWQWAGWKGRAIMEALEELVRPARSVRAEFYWGIVFPVDAVTRPHIALSRAGLDLVEAKGRNLDYFAFRMKGTDGESAILRRAEDLVGDPNRVIAVKPRPAAGRLPEIPPTSRYGILYLNHAVRED